MLQRPDLDGLRLKQEGRPDVWLTFNGRVHRIANPLTSLSLFKGAENIAVSDEIEFIAVGPTLEDGTSLVQGLDGGAIYLLVNRAGGPQLCPISSWESFLDFGFDETKVHKVPQPLLECITRGCELTSAVDVRRRKSMELKKPL